MQDAHIGEQRRDRFGRRRQPQQYAYDNDGNLVAVGARAVSILTALTPPEPAPAAPPVQPARQVRPVAGRAPRQAANARRRGSRRSTQRSGSSSDDPGDEPPSCACGCGRPRAAGQYYSSDECRRAHARERKRQQRARDRRNPERVAERSVERGIARPPRFCRCDGQGAYASDHRWTCLACGRTIEGAYSSVNGHVASAAILEVLGEEADRGVIHTRLERPWRTRPTRSLVQKLRRTRREEVVAV
jgi:hypothetical protein